MLVSCKRRTSTEASLAGCTMNAPTANVDAPNGQGVGFTHRAKVGGFTYALSSSRAVARRTLALWRWLSSFDSFLPQFSPQLFADGHFRWGAPLFANGVRKIPNLNLHAAQQARVKGYFPRDTSFVSVLAKVRRFLSDFVRF